MPYNDLQIPPSAQGKDGIEVLRAAIIDGGLYVTLRRAFDDPSAWGILLADVARQVAGAYAHEKMGETEDVVSAIRNAFTNEVEKPQNAGSIAPIE
jgi:hypothetical protein